MYLVLADKADEFTRIKASVGSSVQRFSNRHQLMAGIEDFPAARIVIVAPSIKPDLAYEIAEELRVQRPLVSVILLRNRLDVATLSAALESGIKDVIDAQDATDLISAIQRCESVSERLNIGSTTVNEIVSRGKVITVYSAKGGCGKTTIAANLAAALAEDAKSKVLLVDLDLQFGDVATALRISPTKTISNALEMQNDINVDGLMKVLLRYENRFDVLLAPANPTDYESISPDFISKVLATLQHKYHYIIVDTSPSLNDVIVRTLQESDLALLLTTLDMPAIKNLKLTLSALAALGFPKDRRRILLNRADLKVGLSPDDVAELVGEDIALTIPSSTKVSAATNQGELIIYAHPGNSVSKAIHQLAQIVYEISEKKLESRVA